MSGSYYSKKKSACGGLLLLQFSQKVKFGLSGGRFFNGILVFALKYSYFFRLRRAGRSRFLLFSKFSRLRRALIILVFFKIQIFSWFLLFSKSPEFSLLLLLFYFWGGFLLLYPRYGWTFHPLRSNAVNKNLRLTTFLKTHRIWYLKLIFYRKLRVIIQNEGWIYNSETQFNTLDACKKEEIPHRSRRII